MGQWIIQRNTQGLKVDEYCNQEDDDCDGIVDDDPKLLVTQTANNGIGSLRYQLTCLQYGDTLFFNPVLDTIQLTEPLILDKQMWWWGNGVANTRIKMDMSLPVFSTAQQGILITNTGNVTFRELSLIQKNNSLVVPFLKNVGIVELRSTRITGNVPTRMLNQGSGQLKTEGNSEVR